MTDPSRRAFLSSSTRKVAEATIRHADAQVRKRAEHWVRPPYALDEPEFLTTCTRCSACVDACPHQVVFPLSSRLGAMVAGTPALDLVHSGCHLCSDWPCVTACDPQALKLADIIENIDAQGTTQPPVPLPKIAKVSINPQSCLAYLGPECGACASSCPVPRALKWHAEKPTIDAELCAGCGLCRQTCIVDPKAIEISSIYSEDVYQNSAGRSGEAAVIPPSATDSAAIDTTE